MAEWHPGVLPGFLLRVFDLTVPLTEDVDLELACPRSALAKDAARLRVKLTAAVRTRRMRGTEEEHDRVIHRAVNAYLPSLVALRGDAACLAAHGRTRFRWTSPSKSPMEFVGRGLWFETAFLYSMLACLEYE